MPVRPCQHSGAALSLQPSSSACTKALAPAGYATYMGTSQEFIMTVPGHGLLR